MSLEIRNDNDHVEILIKGSIGHDLLIGDGITDQEFTNALNSIPKGRPITIGINSQGGDVMEGLGIFNAIKERSRDVTARIDGYAVSIASVIPLAASKVVSPKSSIWMIHEPTVITRGNAADMLKAAELLEEHGEMIAEIYASETGIEKDKVRQMMRDETWFRGSQALELGFADEANDDPVILNALHPHVLGMYRNIPEEILKAIRNGDQVTRSALNEPKPVTRIAFLSSGGHAAAVENQSNNQPKDNKMSESNTTAATTANPVTDLSKVVERIEALSAKLDAIENKVTNAPPGAPPVPIAPNLTVIDNSLEALLNKKGDLESARGAKARYDFMVRDWSHLTKTFKVVDANTDSTSGALLPNIVQAGAITFLQNRLAPLNMFAKIFGQGVLHRNVLAVPKVTAAGTAQSNPTDFEDTTNFVNTLEAVSITPAHIVAGSHITNAQLQSGWDISLWVESKIGEIGDKLQNIVNGIITTGNFGAAAFTGTYAGFGMSDLKDIWAALKKSPVKSIMLDGEYYAQFLPNDLNSFNPSATNTLPGWDGFYLNTYWTGASANTIGFACNPQAIGVGAGLPDTVPSDEPGITSSVITIPGINLDIVNYRWFSKATRTHWSTFELMFGAALGDANAGKILASA